MDYYRWYFPPARMTEEQNLKLPVEIALRTPVAMTRLIETISKGSLKNIIEYEELPQNKKSNEFANQLGDLFDKYGTDKRKQNFHHIYGHIFSILSPNPRILEIGLGSNDPSIYCNMGINYSPGASLKAFTDFSPESIIDGADIDKTISVDGHRIFYVDQTKPETFSNIVNNGELKYDLIIDDGMHSTDSQLFTLEYALQHISNKGYIIIEDIYKQSLVIWKIVRQLLLESNYYCNLIKTFYKETNVTVYVFVCTTNECGKQLFSNTFN